MSYTLRDGHAATTNRGPALLPIEGARAVADQSDLLVLIGYHRPSPEERRAVEAAPVDLAVLTRGPVALLLLQFGSPADTGHVACVAPLSLLDPDADPAPFLGADGDGTPLRVALCDGESGRVRATRTLYVPLRLAQPLRTTGRAQRAVYRSHADVQAAALRVARRETFEALLSRATLHVHL